uniref:Uncharacterized protein n=1 Tax=Rhizophora mucronata TaxID=61149 RepID=A0A2P2PA13_RHIMU
MTASFSLSMISHQLFLSFYVH